MGRVTQADVLRTALDHFRSRAGGFTRENYFSRGEEPGPKIGAACAIGGVEQAIWKLTGDVVPEDVRNVLAQSVPQKEADKRWALYGGVMAKLNAKARRLFPWDDDGDAVWTLEALTLSGSPRVAKKRTLEIFEAVLADVERKR